jgi:predicted N-acetyltransferase YhbS
MLRVLDLHVALAHSLPPFDRAVTRIGRPDDLARIIELAAAEIHPDCAPEFRALVDATPDLDFLVAEVDGTVVSSLALIGGTIELVGTPLDYVQIEFVVTDPTYRNRGLVRSLIEVVHAAAEVSSVPLSIIWGLEYFYRQFGYSYAIVEPRRHRLVDIDISQPDGFECRLATPSDIVALDALQASCQRHADLVAPSSEARWLWVLQLDHHPVVVAEEDGRIEAMARVYVDESGVEMTETAARSVQASDAVIGFARSLGPPGLEVVVPDRSGGGAHFLRGRNEMLMERGAIFVRATNPGMLFEQTMGALNERLGRSSFATWSGSLLLSMYTHGLEIVVERGAITRIGAYSPDSAPPRGDEAAVPPDLVADLFLSEMGAIGLEERYPDVVFGDQRALMQTLFPPVSADVLLY